MQETKQQKIFIVVLNYNGSQALIPCLASVYQSNWTNFEVVIVDNDSKDGSFEKAKQAFSRAHFIKNSTNIGFSRGNNIGIRYALEKFADYIFILNNDAVVERTTLSTLAQAMNSNPSAGIASPIILDANNKIWFAGGSINWNKMKTNHVMKTNSVDFYPTEYVSGCAMFVKKDVFKKIGLFDERFFLYYEDADFSLRAKRAKFDLLMVPAAQIRHLEQSNVQNNLKIYWLVLSGLIFFRTNASFPWNVWLFFYVPLRKLKNFYDLIFSKNETAKLVRKAYQDFKKISR